MSFLLPLLLVSQPTLSAIIGTGNSIDSRQNQLGNKVNILRFEPWELVTGVAWSPDGEYLAAAAGNSIHIYFGTDHQHLIEIPLFAFTSGLGFSPDGSQLAAGSRDGFLRVWRMADLANRKDNSQILPIWQNLAHKKGVNTIEYNLTGNWIASGGNDGMTRVWNSSDGKQVTAIIGGSFAVSSVLFSPDGKTLAIANGNMIRLRDIASGRIIGSFRADNSLSSLAYHPDGSLLASGDSNNGLELWQPETAFRTGSLDYPKPIPLGRHKGEAGKVSALIWQVTFSPDGRLIASAGGDGKIYVWDVKSRSLFQILTGHQKAVTSLAFHPDGKTLASGGLDGTVRIWVFGK